MPHLIKSEVMPLLLEACPSFEGKWKQHRLWWGDEEPLLYVDLGEFVLHLVELYAGHKTDELPHVFDVVERLHIEGDAYVREAATIGLLEEIQTVSQNKGIDPRSFLQYLKPESLRWWDKLNDFWRRGRSK
jgi:hypothetical protein